MDVVKKSVQIFDGEGEFLRQVVLAKSWGRNPSYPSGISMGQDGGLILQDFGGKFPFVRMNEDGSVAANLKPNHKDGRLVNAAKMRVSPSGSLWTCDGHSILELDADGVVVRTLGASPEATQLGKIATLTLDKQGRIYAADGRTGAVHVFEKDGTARHICQTIPSDVSQELWNPTLAVNDAGNVYICIGKYTCLLYTSPSPRDLSTSRMPSSA